MSYLQSLEYSLLVQDQIANYHILTTGILDKQLQSPAVRYRPYLCPTARAYLCTIIQKMSIAGS